MAALGKDPVHTALVDAAASILLVKDCVGIDEILRRQQAGHLRKSIRQWYIRDRLEQDRGFGPLIPANALLFHPRRVPKDKDGNPLWTVDTHPEKFVAGRGRGSHCAGWVKINSDLGRKLVKVWQGQNEGHVGGSLEKVNDIRREAKLPMLRLSDTVMQALPPATATAG